MLFNAALVIISIYNRSESGINKLPLQRVERRDRGEGDKGEQLKKLNDKLFPGPEEKQGSLDKLKINIMCVRVKGRETSIKLSFPPPIPTRLPF